MCGQNYTWNNRLDLTSETTKCKLTLVNTGAPGRGTFLIHADTMSDILTEELEVLEGCPTAHQEAGQGTGSLCDVGPAHILKTSVSPGTAH